MKIVVVDLQIKRLINPIKPKILFKMNSILFYLVLNYEITNPINYLINQSETKHSLLFLLFPITDHSVLKSYLWNLDTIFLDFQIKF